MTKQKDSSSEIETIKKSGTMHSLLAGMIAIPLMTKVMSEVFNVLGDKGITIDDIISAIMKHYEKKVDYLEQENKMLEDTNDALVDEIDALKNKSKKKRG